MADLSDHVAEIEVAIDRIMDCVDQKREPGWSYRNTITSNRELIRGQCAEIRAAIAADRALNAPAQAAAEPLARSRIYEALHLPQCVRLREWSEIGPVQRAAVESFADAVAAPVAPAGKRVCHAPGDRCLACPHYHGKAGVCTFAVPVAPAERAGWRLVPVEPTPEMIRAAGWFDTPQMRRDYTALIDAAPSAKDKP